MVSTPKLLVLLAVVFSIFEITDALKCYTCDKKSVTTKKNTDCGGNQKDWKNKMKDKTALNVECKPEETMCVVTFNSKGGALERNCLDPTHKLEVLFKDKFCVENRPEIGKAFGAEGARACACSTDLCNAGIAGASGIELKIAMILGTPFLLLMIHHFF